MREKQEQHRFMILIPKRWTGLFIYSIGAVLMAKDFLKEDPIKDLNAQLNLILINLYEKFIEVYLLKEVQFIRDSLPLVGKHKLWV